MTRLQPIHPGEILKYEFMEPLGLSATSLAKATGLASVQINEIVNGHRDISPNIAKRFAQYFNTDVQSWMNLQKLYEDEIAEREQSDALGSDRLGGEAFA